MALAHGLTDVFGPADGSQPWFMALGVLRGPSLERF
jgi:hypothetical protein